MALAMLNESSDPLRRYTTAKHEVASAMRELRQLFETFGDTERAERCHSLQVKLAEEIFNLAVVGQFKRGKSSLMNAIIGRDLLPTGVLPLTSVVTSLCYGQTERLQIYFKGSLLPCERPLYDLAEYVTEQGNPGNKKGIYRAQIEAPVPFLRRGLHFIDTPGVGSIIAENTATTYAFLPEADAVIFVTSVDAPLCETEQIFLRDINWWGKKIIPVVNKVDLLDGNAREEMLCFIQSNLENHLSQTCPIAVWPFETATGWVRKSRFNAYNKKCNMYHWKI